MSSPPGKKQDTTKKLIQPVRPRPDSTKRIVRKQQPAQPQPDSMPTSISITDQINALVDERMWIEPRLEKMGVRGMLQKIANLCVSLKTELDGKEIRFSGGRITAGDMEIGSFGADSGTVSVSIPMTSLGYGMGDLPLAAIKKNFDVSNERLGGQGLVVAIATSKRIELMGRRLGQREVISLAFFNQENKMQYRALLKE